MKCQYFVNNLSDFMMKISQTSVDSSTNICCFSDTGGGSKEKELSRKLEILESQLRQEKFLAEDLRKSLSNEKRVVLDSLGKVSQERRSR